MNSCRVASDGPQAFDLLGWIDGNPAKLQPPTGGMTLLRQQDFMVTVVGGPNFRNDYHINPTEELFFQLEGTATPRIQQHERPHDILLPAGHIYVLGAGIPHSPLRGPNTVGIVVERVRRPGMIDTHRWYCETCNNVLFEKSVAIEIVERDMPPVFAAYYADPNNQVCTRCGHRNARVRA
jgi:3-hydroxyanthranilate 3,4-dioxygenase